MTVVLTTGALACGQATAAAAPTEVTVAIVPRGTTVQELARVPALSPGVMSAGIGSVPSEQTFLDVSQGNRIDDALYDSDLPGLFPFAREVPGWAEVAARAADAPADLVPGLLAERLRSAGIPAYAQQPMTADALIAANRGGVVAPLRPGGCVDRCLVVVRSTVAELTALSRRLGGSDLLIAIAAPPPARDRALAIGIGGSGFEGDLTSDSTRTSGYVLSTDIAPTILSRFGLPTPGEMNGEQMRAEGGVHRAAVNDLADRMAVIPGRRAPVLIACLASWIAIAAGIAVLSVRARRRAAAWLALCFAYLPLLLLVGAAIEPGGLAEGLLVAIGGGSLAALTLRLVRGWSALAIACAITVLACAIDVVAGSGLTRLSLLGPNPIFGVRFYGIGNELEALFAVMVPVGVGAGLSAYAGFGNPLTERAVSRRGAVAAFVSTGLLAAVVFAAGRFGADVGAAIVLSVGAAVAVVALPTDLVHGAPYRGGKRAKSAWRLVLTLVATPFLALVLLALIDLVSGGNSHLTRSVLDAGGAGDLADVAQRRLELSAHDFAQAARNPLFWIVVVGIFVAVSRWRRIDAWLAQFPLARAGLIGACVAVAVGVLVNDSGASFLTLGAIALGAFLAFAWSQAGRAR
jgi:hypothetical protein